METLKRPPSSALPHVLHVQHVHIKLISAGDQQVGKSSLIKRFCEGRFTGKYVSTIGVDYGIKQVMVPATMNSKTPLKSQQCKVHFWDLAGHPCFLDVRNEFYKLSQGMILVYSVAARASFEGLSVWLQEASQFGGGEDMVVAVCGNKIDSGKRVIAEAEARVWAESRGFLYFETSASSGEGVAAMFEALLLKILKKTKANVP